MKLLPGKKSQVFPSYLGWAPSTMGSGHSQDIEQVKVSGWQQVQEDLDCPEPGQLAQWMKECSEVKGSGFVVVLLVGTWD